MLSPRDGSLRDLQQLLISDETEAKLVGRQRGTQKSLPTERLGSVPELEFLFFFFLTLERKLLAGRTLSCPTP